MSTSLATSFGSWIKQRRKALDLTQFDLAERAGCGDETIRKIEAGVLRPSKQLARLLAEALGVPSDEWVAFVHFARVGVRGGANGGGTGSMTLQEPPTRGDELAPWRSPQHRPTNLPVPLTSLIGRDQQLATIRATLQGRVRLLTLIGPPGVGKTRLSMEAAAAAVVSDQFPDGVYFVGLAPISDLGLVPAVIARALGVKEAGSQPLLETLREYLAGKRMLLLFDNFEHVLDAAPMVVELLTSGPWLKAMVTSREALHVRGERRFSVEPLELPDTDHLPPVAELRRVPSVALFVERSEDSNPEFTLTEENAEAVAGICARLDGIPLAIELATARIGHLTPYAMLSKLENRLKLLTGGAHDLPARQQTLRAAIEWSYDLLDEGEKQLLRRMAVFNGGRSLEALEAVCNADGDLIVDTLVGVESLTSKSLLHQREGRDGEPRFWMLETIHEYAREKLLEGGEAEKMNRQHAAYFLALAEGAAPKLQGREQANTITQIEENLDNIRTAIRWALEQGEAEDAARIAGALWGFMWSRGYLSEGRRWLEATLESPNLSVDVRATALRACGILAHDQGDYERAHSCFRETLALRRQQDDKSGIAGALNALGVLLLRRGDFQTAKPYYEEALTLFRELEDQARMAVALNNLGVLAERLGDLEQAQDYYGQSLDLARRQGDSEGVAWALDNLGNIACEQGRYDEAWKMHHESLTLFQDQGDKQGIIAALEHIASLKGAQHEGKEAARLFGAAELLREQTGAVIHPSNRDSHERRIATARAGLDEAIWNTAWQEGRTMSLEQALAHAAQPQERQT